MADPITWAVIGGLALAGAGTGYQINASNEAADKADATAKVQKASQDALLKDQTAQADQMQKEQTQAEAQAAAQANNNATSSVNRSKALAGGAFGRSDTILTSPLGLQGTAPTTAKTLLGG